MKSLHSFFNRHGSLCSNDCPTFLTFCGLILKFSPLTISSILLVADAWRGVTDAVRDMRMSLGCPAVSFAGVSGLHMFGFAHSSIAYFTEQLYGARYCHNYRFKFHKPPLFELEEVSLVCHAL